FASVEIFMRLWVDSPARDCLRWVRFSPVRPGQPPATTRDDTQPQVHFICSTGARAAVSLGRAVLPTTWRRMRMRMRQAIGLSLALCAIFGIVVAKEAIAAEDRHQPQSVKTKAAKSE